MFFAMEREGGPYDIWLPAVTAFRYPEHSDAYGIAPPIGQLQRDLPPLQAAAILARQTACWRNARRDDPYLTPGLRDLLKTRGFSLMLNREPLNWPEEVIRIADLEMLDRSRAATVNRDILNMPSAAGRGPRPR
jgi:hypothetical protein